jgi:hypothetical protein
MTEFYFYGLAFLRATIPQMVMMAADYGFKIHAISRDVKMLLPLISKVLDFLEYRASNSSNSHSRGNVVKLLSQCLQEDFIVDGLLDLCRCPFDIQGWAKDSRYGGLP